HSRPGQTGVCRLYWQTRCENRRRWRRAEWKRIHGRERCVFHDGVIEVELAGRPASNAGAGARGFIGIAFRMYGDQFEYIYLRPTNGRAENQISRNHSTQYSSYPKFSFAERHEQSPRSTRVTSISKWAVWTHYHISVEGNKARLYVHGAANLFDCERPQAGRFVGGVALWIGPGAEGYFAGLKIHAAK